MTPHSPHELPLAPPLPCGEKLGAELPDEEDGVTLGMIGLGRMGSNMARRLLRAGHECVCSTFIHSQLSTWPMLARWR
jgi:hypothetical protein